MTRLDNEKHFYSRPYVRGDHTCVKRSALPSNFYSRPYVRGDRAARPASADACNFYSRPYVRGDYDGNEGMGCCLNLSGQGCRVFEEQGSGDFDGLFQLVRDNPDEFHMTRLDVAFDDHTGILDIQQLLQDTDDRKFVTKFRKAKLEKEFEEEGRPGITVYHGSKKSEVLIRIYDKAAERGLPEEQHWIRVELQLRNDRALAFVENPEKIGVKFRGVLVNYLRYVDDNGDGNRWRWPMKAYWEELIAQVERIKLYVKPGMEYNIMQLDHFVFDQAGNAIVAALKIHGAVRFFDRLKSRGVEMNPKYGRLVELYGQGRRGHHEEQPEERPAL